MNIRQIIEYRIKHPRFFGVLAIIWFLIMIYLLLFPSKDLPKVPLFPNMDKLIHFTLYFVFTFLSLFASSIKKSRNIPWIIVLMFVICVTTEILQRIMPYGRSFDYYDMMANSFGIIIGLLFFNYIKKQIKKLRIKKEPKGL